MTIIFLCGSLEQGHDGVGDYTRRMAAIIKQRGHHATIIALYDKYITNTTIEDQRCLGQNLQVLRITKKEINKERYNQVYTWVEKNSPEWISLQFVPFSFHDKGLPFYLPFHLKRIGKNRNWQIMFHELWVGMEKTSPKKEVVWGNLQKSIIRVLLLKLKPGVIHTQSKIYIEQLSRIGWRALHLSLFSNISKQAITYNKPITNCLSFILFGSIHPGTPVQAFASELMAYSKKKSIVVSITMIGRSGSEKANWVSVLQSEGITVLDKGELSEHDISACLSASTFGISTTPLALIEKSGTVAAMLHHNLPVICVAKPWALKKDIQNQFSHQGILSYKPGNLEELLLTKSTLAYRTAEDVAFQFIRDLSQVTK